METRTRETIEVGTAGVRNTAEVNIVEVSTAGTNRNILQDNSIGFVRRNYKDTMFRLLFKEKENLLSLYNAVNGTCYEDVNQLEIVTLENAIFMNMKNDLAFLMDFYLNIYEHQATVNPNMPLRDLFYIAKELSMLIDHDKLYRSKLLKIPTPRFYVFYNGVVEEPERQTLYLSDAFEQPTKEPELELKVTMLNINKGKNKELMERCTVLRDYMLYVEKVRNYSKTLPLEQAVRRTVDECIKSGILRDFLLKHKKEAIEVCIFEYNEERALRYIKEDEYELGRAEGERLGRAEGEKFGRIEGEKFGRIEGEKVGYAEKEKIVIINMLRKGMSDEQICEYADCDMALVDEVKKTL